LAVRPSDPFESEGIASRWSAATRRKTAAGYGRFLHWLRERGELDETADPAARITRERLAAYLDELRRTNRGHTIQTRIQELGDAMQALAPNNDWRFIKRAAGRLRATTIPARDKRPRLPRIVDPVAQGYRMMDEAEKAETLSELGRAALYRDGLLLVFLAYHPLRLSNLASLRIGRHLLVQEDQVLLKVEASETKARKFIEQELSPRLSLVVRRYINRHRKVLLRARGRWHAPGADMFWISRDGSPCGEKTFRNIVGKYLVGPNGQAVSPHLFRSMAATSVSIEAPESVDLIPAILSHSSHRTAEQYYNLADSLDASRDFNSELEAIREELNAALPQSAEED
jgi:integrase